MEWVTRISLIFWLADVQFLNYSVGMMDLMITVGLKVEVGYKAISSRSFRILADSTLLSVYLLKCTQLYCLYLQLDTCFCTLSFGWWLYWKAIGQAMRTNF